MNWKRITLALILVIIIVPVIVIYKFTSDFGADCEKVEEKHILDYKIIKSECLGWAGPEYYPTDVYKSGKRIPTNLIQEDSCKSYYSSGDDKILIFDFCDKKVLEKSSEKELMDKRKIDSIVITKVSSLTERKLNDTEVSVFVKKWNHAIPDGARKINGEYYPEPKYIIDLYAGGKIRKFKTTHITIQEKGSFWSYSILDKGEERTTQKFDEIFNEK